MSEGTYSNPSAMGDAGMNIRGDDDGKDPDLEAKEIASKRFRDARTHRSQYDGGWDRARRYALGDQWANKLRPAWKAKPAPNYCFATIETIIPVMTDNRPTINVIAAKPGKESKADRMQKAARQVFAENRMERKYPVILRNSHWYGDGFVKIWFNSVTGKIEITSVDTRNFFPAPGTIELQDAPYIIIAANRWVDAALRDFPEMKGLIEPGTWDDALTHKPVLTQKDQDQDYGWVNTTSGPIANDPYGKMPGGNEQICTQVEMWEQDTQGNKFVSVLINGVVAIKNGRKLWKIPSPFKHKLYPFAKCACYAIDSQFWSVSEMSQLENPQDGINRMEAMIADIIRMCANPQMLIPRGGRISMKDITNRVGGFIVHENGFPPQWMTPAIFPQQVFEAQRNSIGHMDRISSIFEAARGQRPVGATSGVAIQSLQQATAGRIGQKTRMFECFLQDIAVQVIADVQQFYQDRTIRVGRNEYVEINTFLSDGSPNPETDVSNDEFEVEIGVGSTLPIDKGVRFEQSTLLFDRKALSKRKFLQDSGRQEEEVDQILKELDTELLQDAELQAKIQQIVQPPAPAGAGGEAAAPTDGGEAMPEGDEARVADAAEEELAVQAGDGIPTEEEIAALEAEIRNKIQ